VNPPFLGGGGGDVLRLCIIYPDIRLTTEEKIKSFKGERERVSPHSREWKEKEHNLIRRFPGFALSSF